jgi:eukaryotic-like serine/threonine-protein kinase
MAELFLARAMGPASFEKLVVIKKILPKYHGSSRFTQLFLDEAKLAASLNHANIVQVYDIGDDRGDPFFAMEYLHGQDVRTILHRAWMHGAKMPLRHAIQIAGHVAAALHYAHEKRRNDGDVLGVVHRDVSPSNIIVGYDGGVKLVDFGVAKAATSTHKTRTGTLKGKIAYMSPEQAKGAPLDRRSDIFSLGIVLWEMVTTQRLFRGENDLATLQLIINQPPKRPSEVQPECPPELERIIMKALAQDNTQRYQTAEELQRDLEELVKALEMPQSSSQLAAYISELFAAELQSWHDAQAAGMRLGEHLTAIGDLTTPVSESDFMSGLMSEDIEDDDDEDEMTEAHPALDPTAQPPMTGTIGRPPSNTPSQPPAARPRPPGTPARGVVAEPSLLVESGGVARRDPSVPPGSRPGGGSGPVSTIGAVEHTPPPSDAPHRPSNPWAQGSTPQTATPSAPFPTAQSYMADVKLLQDLAADKAKQRADLDGTTWRQREQLIVKQFWIITAALVGLSFLVAIIAKLAG